jgi:predicted nucleic acid-binding protein
MITALVDTSVLIHLFRKHPAAIAWFKSQTDALAVSSITWLEFMEGVPSKAGQTLCLTILSDFELIRLTDTDQDWAMEQITKYRLSQGVHLYDCLIASVCQRLQVPIYAHNVKDLQKILPAQLVIKPFTA